VAAPHGSSLTLRRRTPVAGVGGQVFAIDPALQSGPLSFAAAAPLVAALPPRLAESAAIAVMALSGLLVVRLVDSGGHRAASSAGESPAPDRSRTLLNGLLVLPVWAELWCRSSQLLLGAAVVTVAVRRNRWPAALAVGVCARMLLDPGTKNYYDAGLVVAASVYDLATAASSPSLTIGELTAVYLPSHALVSPPDQRGLLRAAFFLAAPAMLLIRRSTGESPNSAEVRT
jgi:hypothetical protein